MRTTVNVMILVIIAFGAYIAIQQGVIKKERAENERLAENLDQYGRDISELTLSYSEMKTEKEKGDKVIAKADSILRENNLTIKQLKKLVNTRIVIVERDTTWLTDTIIKKVQNSDLVDVFWRDERNCITVEGFMRTTDPKPEIAITKRAATVEVYDIKAQRKWFQFWRPKYIRVVHSPCGDVQIKEINKK